MVANSAPSKLYFGCAWYPEQWPKESWRHDIRLMQEAGFNVVRLGEFAWSTLEPEPGHFNFDWLEEAIQLLAKAGIDTVIGVPTAAIPAWLAAKSPDTMAIDETGRRVQFGNRAHYGVNSVEFQAAADRLARAMARRFGPMHSVIGWQLDNEYNRYCYCDHCQGLFREFLAQKYGSLETLNQRWSTAYWSQTYSSWDQIPIPIGKHHPSLMLEFKHFITHSYRCFENRQITALRTQVRPEIWITHNFMEWHDGYDHYALAEDLDLASWDWYVGMGHLDYRVTGAAHDLVRGYKRRNFWLMETQPGSVDWREINNTLNKGEARTMAWHAVAHGADAVLYWHWRSVRGGQEQYHGSLLDASGQPRPFFSEASQVGKDFSAASSLLTGSRVVAEVALLNSYDSRWSIQWQTHHKDFDYRSHFLNYYTPLASRNISTDVISADAPLKAYKLVIAPALLILTDPQADRLKSFVENGGHLVLTVRVGLKDEYNALQLQRQPGQLAEAAGVEVEEYYALLDPVPVSGTGFTGSSQIWAELLKVRPGADTRVIARFGAGNGWLDDQPAITEHDYGKGKITVIGACLDELSQRILLERITNSAGVGPVLETPVGVEAARRIGSDEKEIFILINHTRVAQQVCLPWPALEYLSGQEVLKDIFLDPYGIALITRN